MRTPGRVCHLQWNRLLRLFLVYIFYYFICIILCSSLYIFFFISYIGHRIHSLNWIVWSDLQLLAVDGSSFASLDYPVFVQSADVPGKKWQCQGQWAQYGWGRLGCIETILACGLSWITCAWPSVVPAAASSITHGVLLQCFLTFVSGALLTSLSLLHCWKAIEMFDTEIQSVHTHSTS